MIKKILKRMIVMALVMLMMVSIGIWAINAHVIRMTEDFIVTPEEALEYEPDAILVLGAGVKPDRTPSMMLEDRLLQGIDLYQLGVSDRLLMSGDNSSSHYDEVTVMKNYAVDQGVLSKDVFKDHAGFNTYNSIFRAEAIFQVKKMVIVTQEYHLYRALYLADKLGIEAVGVASNPRQYSGQKSRDLREVLARVKDFFMVIIKPDPTFLGDEIPIQGDGDQ